jgi:hypothetical protein
MFGIRAHVNSFDRAGPRQRVLSLKQLDVLKFNAPSTFSDPGSAEGTPSGGGPMPSCNSRGEREEYADSRESSRIHHFEGGTVALTRCPAPHKVADIPNIPIDSEGYQGIDAPSMD